MIKAGDKIEMEGKDWEVVHVTPAIDEACNHDWKDNDEGEPEYCTKCGISFTRYIFCCCP